MSTLIDIKKLKAGDRNTFNQLCKEKYPSLVAYARIFIPEEWAQDVVQDVLFSVWQNRTNLDESKSIQNYLLRSVYNRCLNYIKRGNYSKDFREWNKLRIANIAIEAIEIDKNPVIKRLFDQDLRESLNKAISALPTKTREVFCMSYIDEYSNKDIAEKLNLSVRTVESHIYMALKQLRKLLKSEKLILLFFSLHFYKDFINFTQYF